MKKYANKNNHVKISVKMYRYKNKCKDEPRKTIIFDQSFRKSHVKITCENTFIMYKDHL